MAALTDPMAQLAQLLYTEPCEYNILIPAKDGSKISGADLQKLAGYIQAQHKKVLFIQNNDQSEAIDETQAFTFTTFDNLQQNPELLAGSAVAEWGAFIGTKMRGTNSLTGVTPVPRSQFPIDTFNDLKQKHLAAYAILSNNYDEVTSSLMGDGTYIDQVVIKDYAHYLIEQALNTWHRQNQHNIIPFDDNGISIVNSVISNAFAPMISAKMLATDSNGNPIMKVKTPDITNVSSTDYANRILRNIKVNFRPVNQAEDLYINLGVTLDGGLI